MSKEYKVVKIIDDTSLIINAGVEDDIKYGDKVEIHGVGEVIIDPTTGEELGSLDIIKDRLEVKKIYEKMSVCEAESISSLASSLSVSSVFSMKQKKLNVDPFEISGSGDTTIRVGDLVTIKHRESEQSTNVGA